MADYSISGELLQDLQRRATTRGGSSPFGLDAARIRGTWLDDSERPVSDTFPINAPPKASVEAFHPSGRIQHVPVALSASLDAKPPKGAKLLKLSFAGETTTVPLTQLRAASPLPRVNPERFGPRNATFVFPVFSELFAVAADYSRAVYNLYEWIKTVPPFNTTAVKAAFALDAYFWPTNDPYGHFNTSGTPYNCDDPPDEAVTFLGDNRTARDKLKPYMLDGKFGLVLINSSIRGGAGGMPGHSCPAWASITACKYEKWQAVALHELCHALGLADEYTHAATASASLGAEPNFAKSTAQADVPWWPKLSEQPPQVHSITAQKGFHSNDVEASRDYVALFAGARYSTGYFRPSLKCLMQDTSVHWLCKVCATHVEAQITRGGWRSAFSRWAFRLKHQIDSRRQAYTEDRVC